MRHAVLELVKLFKVVDGLVGDDKGPLSQLTVGPVDLQHSDGSLDRFYDTL